MKHLRKVMTLVVAALMALVVATPAWAGEIKVTPPDGTQADSENTYKLYKVFDAVTDGKGHYSYKLSGAHKTVPTGFILDDGGNVYLGTIVDTESATSFKAMVNENEVIIEPTTSLDATTIAAIGSYVTDADLVDTKEVTGTAVADFTNLGDGYYYVTTTTGTLVVIDTTQPVVEIKDKNEVPPMTKKITGVEDNAGSISDDDAETTDIDEAGKQAIAQVGKKVEYTLTVTKKKGAENYEVNDTMGTGLKYMKDLTVKIDSTDVAATNYTKTETDSSLVVKFNNTYMAGLADDTVITLKYHCLITEDALQTVPAKNTAFLSYGHNPGENKTPTVETETYNAKFSVQKKDGNGDPLAGAGFVLKNAAGKYYKYTAAVTDGSTITPETIEWVDAVADATEYTSDDTGKLDGEFTGLPNGTYTLVENTVPNGYNKAADYEFTIAEKDFTEANLIQSTNVVNNQGAELPSTGGMGTTILYVVGGVMVAGAAVYLLTKKRASSMQ